MRKRLSEDEIKDFIKNKDGVFIKEEIVDGKRFVYIKCNKDDHEWRAELGAIKKGQWCWECYKRNKIKKVGYNKVVSELRKRGFNLLTAGPINLWSDIEIECPKHNHKWITKCGHFKRGASNCKYCGHNSIEMKDIQKILIERNAIFVKRIKGAHTIRNIVLKCNIHNREWTTNANDILKGNRWCYDCALENRKIQFKKIKKAVEDKGGTLLTPNCTGSLTKILVRCEKGHEWETYYDNINQGYWCPKCPWVKQTELFNIMCGLFPDNKIEYNYHGFKWLKSSKKMYQTMEIDIWIPDIKLAIEYDGVQHFEPVTFSKSITKNSAEKNLSQIQRRDRKKNKLISQHPDEIKYFIRFNYKENITKDFVLDKLRKAGVNEI